MTRVLGNPFEIFKPIWKVSEIECQILPRDDTNTGSLRRRRTAVACHERREIQAVEFEGLMGVEWTGDDIYAL